MMQHLFVIIFVSPHNVETGSLVYLHYTNIIYIHPNQSIPPLIFFTVTMWLNNISHGFFLNNMPISNTNNSHHIESATNDIEFIQLLINLA